MIVDVIQEFRLKMMILVKFDGKYASCNGLYMVYLMRTPRSIQNWPRTRKIMMKEKEKKNGKEKKKSVTKTRTKKTIKK